MIQKMSKLQLIAPRTMMSEVLTTVYDFGQVHVDNVSYSMLDVRDERDFTLKEVKLNDHELRDVKALEELSVSLTAMVDYLKDEVPAVNLQDSLHDVDADELAVTRSDKTIQDMVGAVDKIKEKLDEIKSVYEGAKKEHSGVVELGKIVATFAGLMEKAHDLTDLELIGFSVKKSQSIVETIKGKMVELAGEEVEILSADLDHETIGVLVAAPTEKIKKIKELFSHEGVKHLPFPDEYSEKPLREVLSLIKEKENELPSKVKNATKSLHDFAKRYYGLIKKLKQRVKNNLAIYGETTKFAETRFTFVMAGFLPTEELAAFRKALGDAYGDKVIIEELPIAEKEFSRVPVLLKNNSYVRPFQLCMSLFKPPTYGGVDPTKFLAIFFPIIFGMILGDIGYGLIVLIAALMVKKKAKSQLMKDFGFVLTVCAISSIAFGFFFGEVLGTLGHYLGLKPVVNREHIPGMMVPLSMAVGFGAFHVILALSIKVIQSYKHHHNINAHVVEASSTILIILMLIANVLIAVDVLPAALSLPSLIIAGCSFVALFISGGIAGGLEIFGTVGNILSYARIAAIGLQSVIMAMVANKIAADSPIMVVGLGVAILVHAINLILGIFGPTVHGLRLHFVETFGKFVKLEGVSYQPFGRGGE